MFKSVLSPVREWLARYRDENPHTYIAAKRTAGLVLIADALFGLENPFDGKKTRPGLWTRIVKAGGILLFAFAWFFIVGGLSAGFVNNDATEPAVATVTEVTEKQSVFEEEDGTTTTSIICGVRYEYAVPGETSPRSSAPDYRAKTLCKYAAGDAVDILYDLQSPGESRLTKHSQNLDSVITWFRWGPLVALSLYAATQVAAAFVAVAQIIIGALMLRSARNDAQQLLPAGFDLTALTDELKGQLVPLVQAVKTNTTRLFRVFKN